MSGETDPYVQGWLDCAETVAALCDLKAKETAARRGRLLDRILNPSLAEVYRHAAEIARACTVTGGGRAGASVTHWGPYVRSRLEDIRSGKGRENWDGEWPPPAAAAAAWNLAVDALPDDAPTPSVVPGDDDGTVMLIWHKGGWDIEVEVNREGSALLWMHDRGGSGEMYSAPLEEGRDRLRAVLGELARI